MGIEPTSAAWEQRNRLGCNFWRDRHTPSGKLKAYAGVVPGASFRIAQRSAKIPALSAAVSRYDQAAH
jgi:hypothetical protein